MNFNLQRPLTQRLQDRRESGIPAFSGATFDAGTGVRTADSGSVARSEVPAPDKPELLARLWSLRRADSESELQQRLHSLLEELGPIWAEAEALEVEIVAEQRRILESQYQEIRKQGRAQDKIYKKLALEYQQAEEAVRNSGLQKEALVEQVQNLALLQQRGQHLPRWYDEQELAEWNQRVEQAKARVASANEVFASCVQVRNNAASKFQTAQAELEKIGAQEIRLRKKLSGEAFVDPELGLPVSGS